MSRITSVFLDRDGTLIEDLDYLSDPDQVRILPGVLEALHALRVMGCGLFMVSNQSGIGRGYFSADQTDAVNARLTELLAEHGLHLLDSRYCPCDPTQGPCHCRKPELGMWEELRDQHGLLAEHCVMAGDKEADLRFGQNAGFAASCLVLTGYGQETAQTLNLDLTDLASLPFAVQKQARPSSGQLAVCRDLAGVAAFVASHNDLN